MKFFTVSALVFSLACTVGCAKLSEKFGRRRGTTEVSLQLPGAGLSPFGTLNGGMIVYAVSNDGGEQRSFYFANEDIANGAVRLTLLNGTYRFYSIGYTAANMQGTAKCGVVNPDGPVPLIGGTATIPMIMNTANCGSSAFTSSANFYNASTGFQPVKFISCAKTTNVQSLAAAADCSALADKGLLTHARSLRVSLMVQPPGAGAPSAGIQSACFPASGKPLPVGTNPIGAITTGQAVFAQGDLVIFGTNSSPKLYRSTDGGNTFTSLSPAAFSSDTVRQIHGDGNLIFLTTDIGLYKSTDAGLTWSQVNTTSINTGVFVSGQKVFTGVAATGQLSVSLDGGGSFVARNMPLMADAVWAIYYDSGTGELYAASTDGSDHALVYKSTDLGVTWTTLLTASPTTFFPTGLTKSGNSLYLTTGDRTLANSFGKVFISNDNGVTWTDYCATGCTQAGPLGNNFFDVKINQGTIYTGGPSGAEVSVDNGSTWIHYGATELLNGGNPILSIGFARNRMVWVGQNSASGSMGVSSGKGDGLAFPAAGAPILPAGGSAGAPVLATRVDTFFDANCTLAAGTAHFPRGLANGEAATPSAFAFAGDGSFTRLFLQDP